MFHVRLENYHSGSSILRPTPYYRNEVSSRGGKISKKSAQSGEQAWNRLIKSVEQRIKHQQSKLEIVARQIAAFNDLPRGLLEVSAR